uniref:Cob(I)yrinic acid a,c-diamide adenosyltransferase n=1 Tax=Minutocellus polymorphus TaxID=265543 RepID=A0A7S0AFN0_9STRA|mmetsp:Transcript_12571/g.20933  ORF Transcript_12571/g.20933 Transcript_12571/m.20933 type:complete len:188 (+) Transcript_12571:68-631(+)|eukprot:CAMPEP_0197726234 /NCGR_PEP_ID=MMETSP1434-20131217/14338_1 /TAXON_ID=265543 /ORGANISM="Minutocellus polymorphus, Strain CCMP3303" /LENGTH=187 /DNA_ID=CAMNT_0043312097 /DNA_START=39 /DNA_END=602 /DNA_ORIENTATION=+
MSNTEPTEKAESECAEKGYVHIYTGNGKGKTTAAFGLTVRALMAGKKVFIAQFVKSMKYSETRLQDCLKGLRVEQFGHGCFIHKNEPAQVDFDIARKGLAECERVLMSDEYDVVILDEITIAFSYKLLDVNDVVRAIKGRKPQIEVVVTGRNAPQELIELGDLVTEMKEIKHYYSSQGVKARVGIER